MNGPALQPDEGTINGDHYLASTPGQISWGWLPTVETPSPLTMWSGQTVTIDTVSHEGILEDQGRDPVGFFGGFGVAREHVLRDAIEIAAAHPARDPRASGPHVVTGPVRIAGARPGDVLKVEFLELTPRVQYGIISSRHGSGSLPGEMPPLPHAGFVPDRSDPERAGTVCKFCSVDGGRTGSLAGAGGRSLRFPLGALDRPFAETSQHWIAVGLHRDLDEAFRLAVREALRVLHEMHDVPADLAYAYLSAAGDFVVSQVVDDVKGIHCLIRKADFARWV